MKYTFTLALLLAFAASTNADTWDVTGSALACDESPIDVCEVPANIDAVFTTQLVTGAFYFGGIGAIVDGTEPLITDISGTFNGLPITFAPEPPILGGLAGWLFFGNPVGVEFEAGGVSYFIDYQILAVQIFGDFAGDGEALGMNIIDQTPPPPTIPAPEPGVSGLLLAAVAVTAIGKRLAVGHTSAFRANRS